jgi:hypothetical protein
LPSFKVSILRERAISHGENCPEPGFVLNDALVSFGRFVEM